MEASTPTTTATGSTANKSSTDGSNLKCSNSNNNNNSRQTFESSYGGNVNSPCNNNANNNSQSLDDSNGLNKNKVKTTSGGGGERDSMSNISSNALVRQNSTTNKTCSMQFNESSPNNSDSSNSSNTLHANNDINKSCEEETLNNQTTNKNCLNKEDEMRDKTNTSSSNTSTSSGNSTVNASLPNSNVKPTAIVKDENDLVKKEETSISPPNMSPVGFGSIGSQINECNDIQFPTTSKSNDSSSCDKRMNLSGNICNDDDDNSVNQTTNGLIGPGSGPNMNLISSCNSLNNNTNPLNSKPLDGICSDSSNSMPAGANNSCNLPFNPSFIANNLNNNNGPPQGGQGGGGAGGGVGTNIGTGGGSNINNCMEYMQQQNHIFVFSTQLANKGAEAVLSGQFPTIIAYHCTQPATKSFFEDFFLKNPLKMTKLQRQNTLNIMGGLPPVSGPGSSGQTPWLNSNCNTMGKIPHKLSLNKTEPTNPVLNENDLMCWDPTRSGLDNAAAGSPNAMKLLENSENANNVNKALNAALLNDESGGIPSLQGVKVPDENLTPQQRQHREEQLAKLKKMNQFLFPENGGNDFHGQNPANAAALMAGKMPTTPDGLPVNVGGNPVGMLNMPGANLGNKLNPASMRNIAGNLMNQSNKSGTNNPQLETMPNLGEDIIMPTDIITGSGCATNDMGGMSSTLKQGCMSNMGAGGNRPGGLNANRSNQGPPPPYHPTQRSASVPIATQSPNPASPNNPTSNMSLPSPRASNTMGGSLSSTTSPNMNVTSSSSTMTSTANTSTTSTSVATGSGNGSTTPTPCSSAGNSNRNRSSVNNLNSNPSTPVSHVSPNDNETKNINTSNTPDHKSNRPNSQRSRSPLLNDVGPNNNMEPRFPSPGLNFAPNGSAPNSSNPNLPNNFKNQNSLERQNLQQMAQQFCRRSDNMPLNPNSSRNNLIKPVNAFDPISSLAQMSQQLTGGGVGLNSAGVSNSPNNISGLMGGPGMVNDINMNGIMGGSMMGGPSESSMDHCNQNSLGPGGNIGMSGLGGITGSGPGPFGSGNCNLMPGNPGGMGQRLLNPKLCGPNMSGFNPNQVGGMGMRDPGFPGMMPSQRMMNQRMSSNFGNFNVSPNIQVKASTPNTIQYMPVRPQNNNNNNNMRVPPSLEFLQRYANPHMLSNSGGAGGGGGSSSGPPMSEAGNMGGPGDLNKMQNPNNMGVNANNMNQMNFFGNCHQMSGIGGMGPSLGGGCNDQDEVPSGGNISGNHDPMNIPGPHAPMLRGMRPMRQGQQNLQSGVGMNPGSRMQHPGLGNIPPNANIFPGNDNESLECNDPTNALYNNSGPAGLYQQKSNKPHPMNMPHTSPNLNSNNGNTGGSLPNNNNVMNDQNPSSNALQNSVMMGANNSMLNSNIPNSGGNGGGGISSGPLSGPNNMNYKPFMGPASNDLKYAQQYHSFQQQLYATSTRNQQPGGGQQQQPTNAMSPNSNNNAGFYVNK